MVLAHRMALESPLVEAEAIEATEFMELVGRHKVGGVPQTTINHGERDVVGAVPEHFLVAEIEKALKKEAGSLEKKEWMQE